MANLAERVARRAALHQAEEFTSPKALEDYLKLHPDADRSKHTVKKPEAPGAKQKVPGKPKPPPIPDEAKKKKPIAPPVPESARKKSEPPPPPKEAPKAKPHDDHDEHGEHEDHAPEGAKPGRLEAWKDRLKGLSESAQSFVKSAPKAVKAFLGDPEFRKNALKEAGGHLANAPKAMVHRLVDTAKEEVHEYKSAAAGVKKVLSGGKMTKHEKHAFRTVAMHLAIGGSAAAFAATGPLVGAAILAKGMARHIAVKSVKKSLENLHLLDELGHVGHGIAHLFEHMASEKKDVDPDEAMANLVLAAVAKEIENLSDEDLTEVLNQLENDDDSEDDEPNKMAARVTARFQLGRQ